MLQLPHEAGGEEILSLVTSDNFSGLIRKKLEGSGFFGARFRECAGRALLLTRRQLNERMPLWVSRLRSQRLLDSVLQYEDFPILLEAWRTCLRDELDLEGLAKVLADLESGIITWSEARTGSPQPDGAVHHLAPNQSIHVHGRPVEVREGFKAPGRSSARGGLDPRAAPGGFRGVSRTVRAEAPAAEPRLFAG